MVNSYEKQKHIQWNAITVTLIVYISIATEKEIKFSLKVLETTTWYSLQQIMIYTQH